MTTRKQTTISIFTGAKSTAADGQAVVNHRLVKCCIERLKQKGLF